MIGNMNMNKKKRSDWKRMKNRANRKLKNTFLREHRSSRSPFDQLLVEKSNSKKECLEKEINCLKMKLQATSQNLAFFFNDA